ncbi:Phosphate regulon transcriptional regulatory protein PhoB (SphR) [hydrothermal vent metagenome]|uniref:Phosphate regulon transcriptional regulatory protein PhoB (SphR) n=1 Tax=hydrothermal vent metagenome TaxID=652676 RepID=A0A3B0UB60_9ZZZZ
MFNNAHKILIVDDDEDILDLLSYNLSKEGYQVFRAHDGVEALEVAKAKLPELIILDIMMPRMDGVEACRLMREEPHLSKAHIIFLTARSEEYSEVAAFDSGADDFLSKPIKPRALLSRVNSYFKRAKKKEDQGGVLKRGNLIINRISYSVMLEGTKIVLPRKEFELLYFLAKKPEEVFNRDTLLKNIWGSDVYVLDRTVDVHIRKIRGKIGDKFISTIKGVGYKFESDE